jgi:hypothetical protein
VAPLAGLSEGPLLHGGTWGLLAELSIALVVAAFFVAVWLRERRAGERGPAELRDDEDGEG